MSNSYFQFKQFTIQQDKCAMKVTTDGCLFGAIAANEISNDGKCNILDIGTGTGLLSIMVAQQNQIAFIDAIEIDNATAQQANDNTKVCPWAARLYVLHKDILTYQPPKLYDVIISNPPFYEQQLTSPNSGRQQAHHSSGLTLLQLFQQVATMLQSQGNFFVMIPFYRTAETISIAEQFNFYLGKQWFIRQTPHHPFFRNVICFSHKHTASPEIKEMYIQDENRSYSTDFIRLLQPYYLKL